MPKNDYYLVKIKGSDRDLIIQQLTDDGDVNRFAFDATRSIGLGKQNQGGYSTLTFAELIQAPAGDWLSIKPDSEDANFKAWVSIRPSGESNID